MLASLNEENEYQIENIISQINRLKAKKDTLKTQIIEMLYSLSGISKEYSNLPVIIGSIFDALTKHNKNGNVIRDEEAYFNNKIAKVSSLYSDAGQNYYVSLASINLEELMIHI